MTVNGHIKYDVDKKYNEKHGRKNTKDKDGILQKSWVYASFFVNGKNSQPFGCWSYLTSVIEKGIFVAREKR